MPLPLLTILIFDLQSGIATRDTCLAPCNSCSSKSCMPGIVFVCVPFRDSTITDRAYFCSLSTRLGTAHNLRSFTICLTFYTRYISHPQVWYGLLAKWPHVPYTGAGRGSVAGASAGKGCCCAGAWIGACTRLLLMYLGLAFSCVCLIIYNAPCGAVPRSFGPRW